jgi:hypothetical protein
MPVLMQVNGGQALERVDNMVGSRARKVVKYLPGGFIWR